MRFARSGEQALVQVGRAVPELILLDIDMPGIGGLETCRRLKADTRTAAVPVVFVTRFGDEASEIAALDAGAADFMSKPLTATRVLARVRSQLRQRQGIDLLLHAGVKVPLLPDLGRRPRLLVVDDDSVALRAVEQALAGTEAELCFASGGAMALQAIVDAPPYLLMPDLDGWHVLAALQANDGLRSIPVIAITRAADEAHEARALAAGATDFVAKPFNPAVLQARVRNALRLRLQALSALAHERAHWRQLSDARVADIVAAAADAILAVDGDGYVRLANRAAEAPWPTRAGDPVNATGAIPVARDPGLVGCLLPSLWPGLPELLARHPSPLRCALPDPSAAPGKVVELRWSRQSHGSEQLTTLFIHDISDRERAEAAMRDTAGLEAAAHTRARMPSYIAHEIGNPLSGIVGLTQLMITRPTEALQ